MSTNKSLSLTDGFEFPHPSLSDSDHLMRARPCCPEPSSLKSASPSPGRASAPAQPAVGLQSLLRPVIRGRIHVHDAPAAGEVIPGASRATASTVRYCWYCGEPGVETASTKSARSSCWRSRTNTVRTFVVSAVGGVASSEEQAEPERAAIAVTPNVIQRAAFRVLHRVVIVFILSESVNFRYTPAL